MKNYFSLDFNLCSFLNLTDKWEQIFYASAQTRGEYRFRERKYVEKKFQRVQM